MTYYDHATFILLETMQYNKHHRAANWKLERELAEKRFLSDQTQSDNKPRRQRMVRFLRRIFGVGK